MLFDTIFKLFLVAFFCLLVFVLFFFLEDAPFTHNNLSHDLSYIVACKSLFEELNFFFLNCPFPELLCLHQYYNSYYGLEAPTGKPVKFNLIHRIHRTTGHY